jgi:uncharacterized protein
MVSGMKTFEQRRYRRRCAPEGLVSFSVREKETDLLISADRNLYESALSAVKYARRVIEEYGRGNGSFFRSLEPVPADESAPGVIKQMCFYSRACGVGPMAGVAGAVAEIAGRKLLTESREVIVENGGDIFLKSTRKRLVGIYAGESNLSGRLAVEIDPEQTPCGVCSSSGTFGHSLNFGAADAVVVLSCSAVLADAAATACSNMVKDETCIEEAIGFARSIEGVRGVIVVAGGSFGAWGSVKIRETRIENHR